MSTSYPRQLCTCNGNNENCFKCGGFGYIDNDSIGVKLPACANAIIKKSEHIISNNGRIGWEGDGRGPKKSKTRTKLKIYGTVRNHRVKLQTKPTTTLEMKGILLAKSTKLKKCTFCNSCVREDRMARHLRLIHPHQQPRSISPQAAQIVSSPLATINEAADTGRSNMKMDATYDYYAAYRDHGQYGSHPSHDDFDDESIP